MMDETKMNILLGLRRAARSSFNVSESIFAESAEEAFHEVLEMIDERGIESNPRGMKIKELLNVNITIANPRNRIIYCPERKFSAAYAFGELAWYMSARNDLEMMSYYSKLMERGSDDGLTLNSAYGFRIFGKHRMLPFDQWEQVKKLLTEDKDSRQAVIHLHTPNDKATKDEVCTMGLQFLIRDGKLDMITTMRSNDIVLGFTYDVFAFTIMQELMANELGVELGMYHHNAGSMHIYENKFDLLDGGHSYCMLGEMPKIDFEKIKKMEAFEDVIRDGMTETIDPINMNKKGMIEFFVEKLNLEMKRGSDEIDILYKASFLQKAMQILDDQKMEEDLLDALHKLGYERVSEILLLSSTFSRRGTGKKIIVEGMDKVGKSTLIGRIKKDHEDFIVKHYGKPSKDFGYFKNYMSTLRSEANIILDRSFMSELVYGIVERKKVEISKDEIGLLLKEIHDRDIKTIFLIPSDENMNLLKERMLGSDDHDKLYKVGEMRDEYLRLAELMESLNMNVEIRDMEV